MAFLLVTSNRHKQQEFERLFHHRFALHTLEDFNLETLSIDETGTTFAENAALKIQAVRPHVPADVGLIADDSGLEVTALDGAPGIYSARFAGTGATDMRNNEKLIHLLQNKPATTRHARFVCALAYQAHADVPVQTIEGTCSGEIIDFPRGAGGFGYDPHFYLPDLGKTMAELSPDEKDRISHRGNACRQLLAHLFNGSKDN